MLLDGGAQVDAKTNYGRTALHHAVMSNSVECAICLIENGATVDVPDRLVEGTPLDLCTSEEMRRVLEKPEEIMAQAIKAHFARSRALAANLNQAEDLIAAKVHRCLISILACLGAWRRPALLSVSAPVQCRPRKPALTTAVSPSVAEPRSHRRPPRGRGVP